MTESESVALPLGDSPIFRAQPHPPLEGIGSLRIMILQEHAEECKEFFKNHSFTNCAPLSVFKHTVRTQLDDRKSHLKQQVLIGRERPHRLVHEELERVAGPAQRRHGRLDRILVEESLLSGVLNPPRLLIQRLQVGQRIVRLIDELGNFIEPAASSKHPPASARWWSSPAVRHNECRPAESGAPPCQSWSAPRC